MEQHNHRLGWQKGKSRGPMSEEHKQAIRSALKGRPCPQRRAHNIVVPDNTGHPYWGRKSYVMPESTKAKISLAKKGKCAARTEKWWSAFLNSKGKFFNTKIERKVQDWLALSGIEFYTQKKVGRFIYDICIPHYRVLIECDGTYWHSRPEVISHDKEKNTEAIMHGFGLVRLSEKDIESGAFVNALREVL